MISTACNYNPDAEEEDGNCLTNDCAGKCGGDSYVDNCNVCDDNIENDCTQDCVGVWGGTEIIDSCNVCGGTIFDVNDCPQCADGLALGCDLICKVNPTKIDECGVCGGGGRFDMCGVCDNNQYNNCLQDCSGEWGGNDFSCPETGCGLEFACNYQQDYINVWDWSCWWQTEGCECDDGKGAVADNCGTCDSDPNNDCIQDICDVWGGDNSPNTGTCDCNGTPNGDGVADMCGTCDIDPDNDCIKDCAGVWGGDAIEDCAGVCGGSAVDTDGNGICDSDEVDIYGCTNPSACNFDATATIFDDSCWSATEGCECSDGKNAVADNCGTCDIDLDNDCLQDCAGVWGGEAVLSGCDNVCNSTAVEDCAGVCGGTHVDSDCGTVVDIDGNTYKTIKIGNQDWMAENLKVTKYKNGNNITYLTGENYACEGSSALEVTEGYIVSDNNSTQADIYGHLYNRPSALDERGLCMEGWHVPSNDEWIILVDYLGGYDIAGKKLKATNTSSQGTDSNDGLWDMPNLATNESGFSAIPAASYYGFDNLGARYTNKGAYAHFWSTTENTLNPGYGHRWSVEKSKESIYNDPHQYPCKGLSIRCLKD